jgi:ketosteroid isomerase-like protein
VNHHDLEVLLMERTEAWNSRDIERLMMLFAEDCVFDASGGPEFFGSRYMGRAVVQSALEAVPTPMPDCNWGDGRHFVLADDYGVSEWRLTGARLDGTSIDVLGCDFLTIRDTKIVRKNSFRKQRP